MAHFEAKWAVYYGTITLLGGEEHFFSPEEVAELYGIENEDYISVELGKGWPLKPGKSEVEYIHLKPRADGRYFNAIEWYNTDSDTYWGEDFDARIGGKWAVRPQVDFNERI